MAHAFLCAVHTGDLIGADNGTVARFVIIHQRLQHLRCISQRIPVIIRIAHRLSDRIHDVLRGTEIGCPDGQIDHFAPGGDQCVFLFIHGSKDAGVKFLQPVGWLVVHSIFLLFHKYLYLNKT